MASVNHKNHTIKAAGNNCFIISKFIHGIYKLGNHAGISQTTLHHKFSNHTRYEIIIDINTTNKNLGTLGRNLCNR